MKMNKLVIILIWFLDVLAIWIFIPTLPGLAENFNVSAHLISYAIVSYAFFSFISGPILWQLSDIFGRKVVLFLCILGSVISNFLMALTSSYMIFILARIINWITWWNITILSSMMSDISIDKNERMNNMWIIWALFWIWFIIWPAIWSFLLPLWIKAPFWFMAIASVIEILALIFFLKETNWNIVKKQINYNPFSSIFKYLKNKELKIFMISFFIVILSFSLFQWMLSIFLAKEFNLPWTISGYIYSWIWVTIALNQASLLKKFWLKYFPLKKLFLVINIWIFISFLLLFFVKDLTLFLIIFFFLVAFQWVINPIYQSEILEKTEPHNRWEIMWVLGSLQSITMFIWPIVSWFCIDKNISMFWLWAIFVFINIFIVIKLVKSIKEIPIWVDVE